jgi:hypothetical protein
VKDSKRIGSPPTVALGHLCVVQHVVRVGSCGTETDRHVGAVLVADNSRALAVQPTVGFGRLYVVQHVVRVGSCSTKTDRHAGAVLLANNNRALDMHRQLDQVQFARFFEEFWLHVRNLV